MKYLIILLVSFLSLHATAQLKVEDFYKESDGDDWAPAFTEAFEQLRKKGHGSIELIGTSRYTFRSCVELPRKTSGKAMFVVNGNGALLSALNDTVIIFNRIPKNQKEATSDMMKSRFIIRDISFVGGAKAINLGATYHSQISNCNFQGQKLAAVDIQFGLQTLISHCNSMNAAKDNFILRTGEDWGGGANSSQSNHSSIENCRVHAKKGAATGFKVLGSGGVSLRNIISEGHALEYAVYVDYLKSTTVRYFNLENLHLEHKPSKAGIYVRSSGISNINGVFYQLAYPGFKLIETGYGTDQIQVKNIPHFVNGTILQQNGGGGSTTWVMESCKSQFYNAKNWRVMMKNELKEQLPPDFVEVGRRF